MKPEEQDVDMYFQHAPGKRDGPPGNHSPITEVVHKVKILSVVFARAAIAKHHRLNGLKNKFVPQRFGAWKSKIKVSEV